MTRDAYLKNRDINKYLNRLSEIIMCNQLGAHSILIVGGAAIALKNKMLGRATVDIDICFKWQNKLYQCCSIVAAEYGLPEDWMNADVMHSESYSNKLFDNAELYKVYNNVLSVYVINDIDLACMKLVAFRPKDIIDLDRIIKRLKRNKVSYTDIVSRFKELYGSTYLLKDKQNKYLRKSFNDK